jgi:hypothetical protein
MNWKLNANAFYQSSWMRYYDPDFLNLQGYIDNAYLQHNGGGGFILKRSVLKNRAFVFGGSDLIFSDLKSGSDFNPNRMENNSVVGAHLLVGKLLLESNVTLQAVRDRIEVSGSITEKNFLEASPFVIISAGCHLKINHCASGLFIKGPSRFLRLMISIIISLAIQI